MEEYFDLIKAAQFSPPLKEEKTQKGVSLRFMVMAEFSKILRYYGCHNCGNLISRHDDIVSKNFQGGRGRAFLFSHAANLVEGPKEDRILITGLHTVTDVFCIDCGENLGWKYEHAYHDSEKYKVGKYVLERLKIAEAGS